MRHDTDNRLARTLRIFRSCRLFNYEFVASQALITLEAECHHLMNLAICSELTYESFVGDELSKYKELADAEMAQPEAQRADHWTFWLRCALELKTWFRASRDVCLITPSSATIERVFSLLSQGFHDSQGRALEDYKSSSIKIRYNCRIWGMKIDV